MTGYTILQPGVDVGPPHLCNVPYDTQSIHRLSEATACLPARAGWENAVIRCNCGQHWWCDGRWWEPITARRAHRIIRRTK